VRQVCLSQSSLLLIDCWTNKALLGAMCVHGNTEQVCLHCMTMDASSAYRPSPTLLRCQCCGACCSHCLGVNAVVHAVVTARLSARLLTVNCKAHSIHSHSNTVPGRSADLSRLPRLQILDVLQQGVIVSQARVCRTAHYSMNRLLAGWSP